MHSIYFKNFIVTATVVLVSFIVLGALFMWLGRHFIVSERRGSMSESAEEVVRSASAMSREDMLNSWDLRMVISSVARTTGYTIFICDSEGRVVSCSEMDPSCGFLGKRVSPDVLTAINETGGLDAISDLGGFYDEVYYVVAMPVTANGALIGYVFVGADSSTIVAPWNAFIALFFFVALCTFIFATCLSFVYSRHIAKPLDDMALASRQFAHGDFSVRVEDDGRTDEVGALVSSFNAMADSLETAEERRRDFIANVSHELKTPMTTISGFADGILDGTIPKDEQGKYLATISSETKRLNRLVRGMLDISQYEGAAAAKARRSNFNLSELIVQTMLSFEARANEKNLDVDLQLPEEGIFVFADKDAITQVVYNLFDNALKFSLTGSMLGVRLWKQNGLAYVAIKNIGATIPEDELPFIFDRFHKTDKSRSLDKDGVGLGLYIVKTILNNHDQDIAVASRNGATEFTFSLALSK